MNTGTLDWGEAIALADFIERGADHARVLIMYSEDGVDGTGTMSGLDRTRAGAHGRALLSCLANHLPAFYAFEPGGAWRFGPTRLWGEQATRFLREQHARNRGEASTAVDAPSEQRQGLTSTPAGWEQPEGAWDECGPAVAVPPGTARGAS
ncbi:MAG: hypothetical protein RIB60_07610 [Phycisphaerales bacterium]